MVFRSTNQFTISALTPATHDGTCLYGTTPVTGVGQTLSVSPTSPCQAPACGWATLQAATDFGFGTLCDDTWETIVNNACTGRKFKLTALVGGIPYYLYGTTGFGITATDPGNYYIYSPSAKTLALYSSADVRLGYAYNVAGAGLTLSSATSGTATQWTPTYDSGTGKWIFRNDSSSYILFSVSPFANPLAAGGFPPPGALWTPVFI